MKKLQADAPLAFVALQDPPRRWTRMISLPDEQLVGSGSSPSADDQPADCVTIRRCRCCCRRSSRVLVSVASMSVRAPTWRQIFLVSVACLVGACNAMPAEELSPQHSHPH